MISVVSELDCLISLSVASSYTSLKMCRPTFIPYDGHYSNTSIFEIKDMVHPLIKLHNGKDFVPNNTRICPAEGSSLLLVTGPNMGGKSTLLR